MQVDSYSGSTVQVFEGQRVVSTGPYALVRHPMYAGSIVMLLGTPLALGSWWGLLPAVLFLPVWPGGSSTRSSIGRSGCRAMRTTCARSVAGWCRKSGS
jgi:protein-S-isoprenylcysteine O-methyltransferase Ste14